MNLYVRQVAGGQPIRLTSDGAANTWPDFSPDGSRIVFRSNRGGGGIYEIPAFGGQSRLLSRQTDRAPKSLRTAPKWHIGPARKPFTTLSQGVGSVWVVPAAGGQTAACGAKPSHELALRSGPRTGSTSSSSDTRQPSCTMMPASTGGWPLWMEVITLRPGCATVLIWARLPAGSPAGSFFPLPSCWSAYTDMVFFSIIAPRRCPEHMGGLSFPATREGDRCPQAIDSGCRNRRGSILRVWRRSGIYQPGDQQSSMVPPLRLESRHADRGFRTDHLDGPGIEDFHRFRTMHA